MDRLVNVVSEEMLSDLKYYFGLSCVDLSRIFTRGLQRPVEVVSYAAYEHSGKTLRRDFDFSVELGKDRFMRIFVTEIFGARTHQEVWKSPKPLNKGFDQLQKNGRVGQ